MFIAVVDNEEYFYATEYFPDGSLTVRVFMGYDSQTGVYDYEERFYHDSVMSTEIEEYVIKSINEIIES